MSSWTPALGLLAALSFLGVASPSGEEEGRGQGDSLCTFPGLSLHHQAQQHPCRDPHSPSPHTPGKAPTLPSTMHTLNGAAHPGRSCLSLPFLTAQQNTKLALMSLEASCADHLSQLMQGPQVYEAVFYLGGSRAILSGSVSVGAELARMWSLPGSPPDSVIFTLNGATWRDPPSHLIVLHREQVYLSPGPTRRHRDRRARGRASPPGSDRQRTLPEGRARAGPAL